MTFEEWWAEFCETPTIKYMERVYLENRSEDFRAAYDAGAASREPAIKALTEDRDWWERQAYIRAYLVEKIK